MVSPSLGEGEGEGHFDPCFPPTHPHGVLRHSIETTPCSACEMISKSHFSSFSGTRWGHTAPSALPALLPALSPVDEWTDYTSIGKRRPSKGHSVPMGVKVTQGTTTCPFCFPPQVHSLPTPQPIPTHHPHDTSRPHVQQHTLP